MEVMERKQNAIVLVPVYHGGALVWNEKISFAQVERVFSDETVAFLMPQGLRVSWVKKALARHPSWCIAWVPAMCMQSVAAYNRLMLTSSFYRSFLSYAYVLICQLDALPFSNRLEEFCQMGYDYYGAPWQYLWSLFDIAGRRVRMTVGNGGFSLRRVAACIDVLEQQEDVVSSWTQAEDAFFAYAGKYLDHAFRVAPLQVARHFSVESDAARQVRKNGGRLPFGCHAWARYSSAFYREAITRLGYDLGAHASEMQDLDFKDRDRLLQAWKAYRLEQGLSHRR